MPTLQVGAIIFVEKPIDVQKSFEWYMFYPYWTGTTTRPTEFNWISINKIAVRIFWKRTAISSYANDCSTFWWAIVYVGSLLALCGVVLWTEPTREALLGRAYW